MKISINVIYRFTGFFYLSIIAALVAAGCGGGGGGGRTTTGGNECASHDSLACYDGDVYWYDSCGSREEIYLDCSDAHQCSGAQCVLREVTWENTYGGALSDSAESVVAASDYGYAAAGDTKSYGSGASDFRVVKVDYAGTQQWAANFGGTDYDEAKSIVETIDGGYAVVGHTFSQGAGQADIWLVKLNSSGTQQWEQTFGGAAGDFAESVIETQDGGLVIAGYTYSQGSGSADIIVIRTDSSGVTQWEKVYGGAGIDVGVKVRSTSGGGYVVAGYTSSEGAGGSDVRVILLDSAGDAVWQKVFGGADEDRATDVRQAQDGGYIVCGFTESYGSGEYDAWVLKLDTSGSIEWDQELGGGDYDAANSIVLAPGGGYVFAGYNSSEGAGSEDGWVVKIDSTGAQVWSRTFGGAEIDVALSIETAPDGGYIVGGHTASSGSGQEDFWLLKLDENGQSGQ